MLKHIRLRSIIVSLITVALCCVAGCHCHPYFDEPDLAGSYHGTYAYQKVVGSDTLIDEQALITFRFTSSDFSMYKDSSIPESLRVFCDVAGEYELEDGVVLYLTDSSATPASCPKDWGPGGFFGVDQTTDSVKLTQVRANRAEVSKITTRIRLLKDE